MNSYMVPNVVETTPRGERVADIFSRLLSERIVFVGTPIDDGVANVVVAQILHLAASGPGDVNLYLNSPGGSFSATMAIYDTMQFVPCDVSTLCVGNCASSAAMLLAGGTDGKRGILPHGRVLLQQPHAEVTRGSLSDLALEAAELRRVRDEAEAILGAHCGRSPNDIRSDTDRALVLAGQAAVDYGVVDAVLSPPGRGWDASGGQHHRSAIGSSGA